MAGRYVPELGDIVWVDFEPQAGREINKRRPAIILTPKSYNQISSLCVLCPISSKIKGHLFETLIEVKGKQGAVKSDQLKSMDWVERKMKFIEKAPKRTLLEVRQKVTTLLFDDMF